MTRAIKAGLILAVLALICIPVMLAKNDRGNITQRQVIKILSEKSNLGIDEITKNIERSGLPVNGNEAATKEFAERALVATARLPIPEGKTAADVLKNQGVFIQPNARGFNELCKTKEVNALINLPTLAKPIVPLPEKSSQQKGKIEGLEEKPKEKLETTTVSPY